MIISLRYTTHFIQCHYEFKQDQIGSISALTLCVGGGGEGRINILTPYQYDLNCDGPP